MKSYTDIEQSKKLAEILPIESADMRYSPLGDNMHPWIWTDTFIERDAVPCWSLAALLQIIPQEIFDGKYIINITKGEKAKWVINYSDWLYHTYNDNLVDACVEIIINLHKQNQL